jgi:DNA-binding response OmpR family regulator
MPQILIVEDDQLLGMVLAEMLDDMDLSVCAIETTESGAVEAALRLRPDLVLVDARLGGGSGIAAMEAIERHGKVPHIFMSGDRLPAGLDDAPMLMKPFSLRELKAALRRVLHVATIQG